MARPLRGRGGRGKKVLPLEKKKKFEALKKYNKNAATKLKIKLSTSISKKNNRTIIYRCFFSNVRFFFVTFSKSDG